MKKGYTLIELLAVIVVLAIIITIVTITTLNTIRDTNDQLDEATLKVFYNASESYLNDNFSLASNGNYVVTIRTLMDNNLISNTFIESVSDNRITENSCVKINITNGLMNYEFSYTCD